MPFFIFFLGVPFIEILIFMSVGDSLGFLNTLGLAFLTAIIGGLIVQKQGIETLLAIKSSLGGGQLPLRELFDGICLVAAGAMLITPGFLTDAIGFTLLVPQARAALRAYLAAHTKFMGDMQESHRTQPRARSSQAAEIIDVDYEEIHSDPTKR